MQHWLGLSRRRNGNLQVLETLHDCMCERWVCHHYALCHLWLLPCMLLQLHQHVIQLDWSQPTYGRLDCMDRHFSSHHRYLPAIVSKMAAARSSRPSVASSILTFSLRSARLVPAICKVHPEIASIDLVPIEIPHGTKSCGAVGILAKAIAFRLSCLSVCHKTATVYTVLYIKAQAEKKLNTAQPPPPFQSEPCRSPHVPKVYDRSSLRENVLEHFLGHIVRNISDCTKDGAKIKNKVKITHQQRGGSVNSSIKIGRAKSSERKVGAIVIAIKQKEAPDLC